MIHARIPLSLLMHLAIFIFFFLLEKSLCVDPYFETCSLSRTCGGLNISFPFYIEGLQDPICGYLGFNVSCLHNTTILTISENPYIIHQIFYQNQTLRVSNALGNGCLPLGRDLLLPNEEFELAHPDGTDFFFFLSNCSAPLPDNLVRYKINCSGDDGASPVLAMSKGDSNWVLASEKCGREVKAPFEEKADDGSDEIGEELVRRGFMLKWKASDCSVCEGSGGKCGYNISDYHFKCFCPDRPHAKHCVSRNDKTLKLALGLGIVGSIPFLIICFFIIRQRRKGKYASTFLSRNTSSDPSSQPGLETAGAYFGIAIFPYTELEEATNYFDPDREIGDGGFGSVYHGQLRDGREVAVKRLYENNYRRVEQFMNEVQILTRLRHRNLVSLYGCTSRHSRELLLVYEFIPNGTVADHLHGDRADSGLLTWRIRLSIAIETATALCYLHASDVVHRDVKTSNILLDNSFCVKVADFGLSRLFPTDVTHVSTAPQGTPGYVDPEYHQCYQLTDKSDVYSFGVVLIELISSLPAVDISRHRHEINLSNYAINKIQKCAFHELMDPHLGFDSDLAVNRMTTLVAELAFRCLQPDKEMRPSMDEVLEILKEIESDKHELENMDTAADSVGSSMRKPPSPSPDCDEVGLLKSAPLMPSPDTVIARWPSMSTTPSASA